ncbi:MAG: MBL fold metallo-hydrolase, partial [Alphaproteobacteria bacterium]|nr:MBL fold metallo-hydrolase [Alphaproteobacteria bacterium]
MTTPKSIIVAVAVFCLSACDVPLSEHPLKPATLGTPVSNTQMLAAFDRKGEATLEKVKVADWAFRRGYVDPVETETSGEITIHKEEFAHEVYIYALRHPTRGLYLIDAGFSNNHEDAYGFLLKGSVRNEERLLVVHTSTIDWLSRNDGDGLQGVFLTHLHFDHMQGVADLDPVIPLYAGPGAGSSTHIYHRMISQPTALALSNRPPLEAWRFDTPEPNTLAAVDVFGDGMLFALHVPGHTPGSTAYLVNAADGAHLITGDAVHTTEGWTGPTRDAIAFDAHLEESWVSVDRMRALA